VILTVKQLVDGEWVVTERHRDLEYVCVGCVAKDGKLWMIEPESAANAEEGADDLTDRDGGERDGGDPGLEM
jgi:hypothetical protein